MPNKKGGKNYKKSKHADDAPIIYERLDDQMYARVIKVLGSCNLLVYCNDNRERICHIRGNMRKKVWISPGDLVLISIRDEKVEPGKHGRGDVCAKYDPSVINRVRQKDPSINPKLFLLEIHSDKGTNDIPVEEAFVFDGEDNNEDEEESDSETKPQFPKNRVQQRIMEDEDICIDDI
jgi:translation initiation factor 1A